MVQQISIIIIVKNGANTLGPVFESLKTFDEIVVYDNGSTDGTRELASTYENVSLHQGEFLGFGKTKQKAVSLAKNDWVFSLDADEPVDEELIKAIESFDFSSVKHVGLVNRKNYFMDQYMPYAGWGNDKLIRLFNRTEYNFNDNRVHESVSMDGEEVISELAGFIHHNAIQEISQVIQKTDHYSEMRREQGGKNYPAFLILLRAVFTFIKLYFIKGGFLAGWRGMTIAWSNADGVFFKYMKIHADNERNKKGSK